MLRCIFCSLFSRTFLIWTIAYRLLVVVCVQTHMLMCVVAASPGRMDGCIQDKRYFIVCIKWVSFHFFCSFGVLHFVRPPLCINVRHVYLGCLALCVLYVMWGHSEWVFLLFLFASFFLVDDYSACIFLACFRLLCVTVQIHNEVGTNGTPCTHTLMFLASNVLLLFFFVCYFFYSKVLNMKLVFIRSVDTER